jgi:hypothetical protein
MVQKTPIASLVPTLALTLAAAVALGGCEQVKQTLGQGKQAPDEFAVFQRAPLSVPPDFGLRPPTPGIERPQTVNPREQARAALTRPGAASASAGTADMSAGERSILQLTGANQVDPTIRARVNSETRDLEQDNGSVTDKIVFWRKPGEFGTAIDPALEQKRLREAQAEGTPLNEGDLPTIKQRQKALFER